MYKLIIIFEQSGGGVEWQQFLKLAEKMPGLRRENITRPDRLISGNPEAMPAMIHELIFDTREALEAALSSPEGRAAGQSLQSFAGGQVTILTSEHMEATEQEFRKKE